MKFVTFNIRGAWFADGQNALIHRIGMIFKKIDDENPDIVCFQEMTDDIRDFFTAHFHGYTIIGVGREKDYSGEMTSVMIKNSALDVLGFETFWLSDTPYVSGSRFPCQSEYPRVCTVATLKEKDSSVPFFVYNVHLDIEEEAALSGVKKVILRIAEDREKYGFPFVFAGDFNSDPLSETMRMCFENVSPVFVEHTEDISFTRHGFMNRGEIKKIDYIFTDDKTAGTVSEPNVWDDNRDGVWLSDHFPISVTFDIL